MYFVTSLISPSCSKSLMSAIFRSGKAGYKFDLTPSSNFVRMEAILLLLYSILTAAVNREQKKMYD